MWQAFVRGVRSLGTPPTCATGIWRHAAVQQGFPALQSRVSAALITRTMKVVSSLKKRCEACRIVRRGKISYVYCSVHPRHKARQGPKRRAGWRQ